MQRVKQDYFLNRIIFVFEYNIPNFEAAKIVISYLFFYHTKQII